jgi:hypothetical protein
MDLRKLCSILIGVSVLGLICISSCKAPEKKESGENGVLSEIKEGAAEVMQEVQVELDQLKKEAYDQIASNKKVLEDLKSRSMQVKGDVKAELESKIADLEKRNRDLEQKIEAFGGKSMEDWKSFKAEFKRDMDELGNAFRNLSVKNIK